MTTYTFSIDWRDEFSELEPYISGSGGVVRVRFAGDQCAPTYFIQALSAEYDARHERWQSVRLDRGDFYVRFLPGVRSVFERKLRLDLPQTVDDPVGAPSIVIGSDIDGEGDIIVGVGDVYQEVHNYGESDVRLFRNRDRWIDALCEQLREFLNDGRVMLILNHSDPAEQDEFWRFMWRDRLERLLTNGLSLVHFVESGNGARSVHNLSPAPNSTIDLPTAFNASQKTDATEDMTRIFLIEVPGISQEEARSRADTLTMSHYRDIPRLYAEFSALLNALQLRVGCA